MYPTLVVLHVLGATVWTGGHLVLALGILPRSLRERSVAPVQAFEAVYERIGIPALLLQVVTGLWLAWTMLPDPSQWLGFGHPLARTLTLKFTLLGLTLALALDARLRIIPRLTERELPALAAHIILVTLFSVAFVAVGVLHRFGGVG